MGKDCHAAWSPTFTEKQMLLVHGHSKVISISLGMEKKYHSQPEEQVASYQELVYPHMFSVTQGSPG